MINQDNRDGQIYRLHGRVDYTLSPKFAVFTAAEGNQRDLRGTPTNPLDSSGYRLLTGANIELTHLITGEFAAGYTSQRFADVTVGTIAGLAYRALLKWSPTRLLDLHFKAERVVTESADTTSTGVRADGVEVGADYELRRNVILSLAGAYELEKFFSTRSAPTASAPPTRGSNTCSANTAMSRSSTASSGATATSRSTASTSIRS